MTVPRTILSRVSPRRPRRLVAGNALLAGLLLAHALDHALRQEAAVPGGTSAAGAAGFAAVLLAFTLAAAGHSLAAPATTVVGFAIALGFLGVHVLPDWGLVSQPYPDIPVDGLSWVAMIVPAAAGMVLGGLGLSRLRRPG